MLASVQCNEGIPLSRPNGGALTAANSARSVDLKAGRIVRVDAPEPGKWKVKLSGTGLYVVSVRAQTRLGVSDVHFQNGEERTIAGHLSGAVSGARLLLTDGSAEAASDVGEPAIEDGSFQSQAAPPFARFRVMVSGQGLDGLAVSENLARPVPRREASGTIVLAALS